MARRRGLPGCPLRDCREGGGSSGIRAHGIDQAEAEAAYTPDNGADASVSQVSNRPIRRRTCIRAALSPIPMRMPPRRAEPIADSPAHRGRNCPGAGQSPGLSGGPGSALHCSAAGCGCHPRHAIAGRAAASPAGESPGIGQGIGRASVLDIGQATCEMLTAVPMATGSNAARAIAKDFAARAAPQSLGVVAYR